MTTAVAFNSFNVQAGQDIDLNFSVLDKAFAAVDVTGATFRFVLARSTRSTAILDSAASPATATITVTDEATGQVTVTLTDTNTDALVGDYYYEMKLTDASNAESVVARGYMTVERSLTSA